MARSAAPPEGRARGTAGRRHPAGRSRCRAGERPARPCPPARATTRTGRTRGTRAAGRHRHQNRSSTHTPLRRRSLPHSSFKRPPSASTTRHSSSAIASSARGDRPTACSSTPGGLLDRGERQIGEVRLVVPMPRDRRNRRSEHRWNATLAAAFDAGVCYSWLEASPLPLSRETGGRGVPRDAASSVVRLAHRATGSACVPAAPGSPPT